MTPAIHFAHANGFPAPVYRLFLNALKEHGMDVTYLNQHAHNPDYPVTDGWEHLADELIAQVRAQHTQPVIAVGHSLGGVLSLLASRKAPELFQGVIMLDSPLLSPLTAFVVRMAKVFGQIDRITPAGRTEGRKSRWSDRDEALAYFKSKSLFRHIDPQCLEDYVDHGLLQTQAGLQLSFDPDTEVAIYRRIPHRPLSPLNDLSVPTALLYGDRSDVVTPGLVRIMNKQPGMKAVIPVSGGHMFPLEQPHFIAAKVVEVVKGFTGKSEV